MPKPQNLANSSTESFIVQIAQELTEYVKVTRKTRRTGKLTTTLRRTRNQNNRLCCTSCAKACLSQCVKEARADHHCLCRT
jgi:hypothetical protein